MVRGQSRKVLWIAAVYAMLAVVNLLVLFPFYSMLVTSFKDQASAITLPRSNAAWYTSSRCARV